MDTNTRRQFLTSTATAVAGLAVVGPAALAAPTTDADFADKMRALYKRVGDQTRANLSPEQIKALDAYMGNTRTVERVRFSEFFPGVTDLSYDAETQILTHKVTQGAMELYPDPVWEPIPWDGVMGFDILRLREADGTLVDHGTDLAIFMAGGRADKTFPDGVWGVKARPVREVHIFYTKVGDPEGQTRVQTVNITQGPFTDTRLKGFEAS